MPITPKTKEQRIEYAKDLVRLHKPSFEFGEQGPAYVSWAGTSANLTPDEVECFAHALLEAAAQARELNTQVGVDSSDITVYGGW